VDRAVYLDYEACVWTVEVHDELPYRVLASELFAVESAIPKRLPQLGFPACRIVAKSTSYFPQLAPYAGLSRRSLFHQYIRLP